MTSMHLRTKMRGRLARIAGACLFSMSLLTPAMAAAQPSPVGVWRTIDDETGEARSLVRIWEHDGKLYGKIVELFEDPDALCEKCEGAQKDKPVMGMLVMWGMEPDEDDAREWEDGTLFDPEKGKTYRGKLELENPDTLEVRGYLGPFSRKQVWHRVR